MRLTRGLLKAAASSQRSRTVLAETARLSAFSVLSPVAGLALEMVLAWRFGASPLIDAYRVTVLLMLFGQQWFVSSILPCVIVPVFAEFRAQGKEEEAWAAADVLGWLLLTLGSGIALFLFWWPGFAVRVLAPGLNGTGQLAAVFLVRWCGLAFVPLCWSGVACGILYAHKIFRIAPLAQAGANLTLLAAILIGGAKAGAGNLAAGLLAGAWGSAGLYAVELLQVRRQFGLRPRPRGAGFGALQKTLRLAAPLICGLLAGQVTSGVVTRALSQLAGGSLAAFGYSWKLGQIVLLVPNALSTVLFPKFSQDWQSKGREQFTLGQVRILRAVLFVTIPLACVCFAQRRPIVALLLERGAFSISAGNTTAALFGVLILGAPGSAAVMFLDRMFYAAQDTTSPALVDIAGGAALMAVAPAMASRFGVMGVAVTTMLLPWFLCSLLLGIFQYRHGGLPLKQMCGFGLCVVALAAISAWFGATLGAVEAGFLILSIGSGAVLAALSFFAASLLLGLPEAVDCKRRLSQLGRPFAA